MGCIIDKETLDDFKKSYIVPSINDQRRFPSCYKRCQEIISKYKVAFPCDCAQLDMLLLIMNQGLVSVGNCPVAMCEVVTYIL